MSSSNLPSTSTSTSTKLTSNFDDDVNDLLGIDGLPFEQVSFFNLFLFNNSDLLRIIMVWY